MTTVLPSLVEEAIEAALESCGGAWSKRETGWAVVANARMPREVLIRREGKNIVASSVLVQGDEASAEAVQAISHFLGQAQGQMPNVRFDIEKGSARVAVSVRADEVDEKLTRAVLAVGSAVRSLSREAAALLQTDAAQAYLAFHSGKS